MPTTTPNFGWSVPVSTDLVKDGATAIELLGDSIDASLVDLKGGTTGQVLAKASGTDMDFTWATDASGIPATIFDAKGDLIAASAADTAARLAVGTNGQILTADSTTATGLAWATPGGGGGMTSIASGSLSGSSLSLTSISGSYKNLQLVFRNAQCSTNTDWRLKINNNGGSIYDRVYIKGSSSTFAGGANENLTSVNIGDNNPAASVAVAIVFDFYDYTKTSSAKQVQIFNSYQRHTTGRDNISMLASMRDDNAITRIDVSVDSGNFTAGTYILYGVN